MEWFDVELRRQLFLDVPAVAEVWVGGVVVVGEGREVVPVRFAGLDFVVFYLSPHVEADHDQPFLLQQLDTLDVHGFIPDPESRLIKFCRADATEDHFKPSSWNLQHPHQIFQFLHTLGEAMRVYVGTLPHVRQYLYLPANERLGRLYQRVFNFVLHDLNDGFVAILPASGACHAYERS